MHYLFFIFFTTLLCSWFEFSSLVTLQSASTGSAWRRETRCVLPWRVNAGGRSVRQQPPHPPAPVGPRPFPDPGAFSSLWLLRPTVLTGERWAFVEAKDCPGSWRAGRPRGARPALCVCPACCSRSPRPCRRRCCPVAVASLGEGTVLVPGRREITKASRWLVAGVWGQEGKRAARAQASGSAEAARLAPTRRRLAPLFHSSLS